MQPKKDSFQPQLSDKGQRLTFGLLKELVSQVPSGDVVGLHGGLPPPECFPIKSIHVELSDGQKVTVPAQLAQQQYNISPTGLPQLNSWCNEHTQRMHAPPAAVQPSCVVVDSSTHGLEIATSLLLNPGDGIVVEEFTYPHFLECTVAPQGYVAHAAPIDRDGLIPDRFEALLHGIQAASQPMPKLLYTVPIGQNPTGAVAPAARKRKIYEICRKYDLAILEDDPYCYIQFPTDPAAAMPGLRGLQIDSYLSMDEDGRVVRLDSFAKSFAPGLRLGWATATPFLSTRIAMALSASNMGPSMVSQAMAMAMLKEWGEEGVHRHLCGTQQAYSERAAALEAAARRELEGLAEWSVPRAGMFMWLKLLGVGDSLKLLPELVKAGLVVVPGGIAAAASLAQGHPIADCPYVRISFSHATPADLDKGMQRLGAVLRSKQNATSAVPPS